MHTLPIPLLLPIKNRIFILRHHLLLARHLRFPPLDGFCGQAGFCQRVVEDGDDGVDGAEAFTVTRFLRAGEPPGDFPGGGGVSCEFRVGRGWR